MYIFYSFVFSISVLLLLVDFIGFPIEWKEFIFLILSLALLIASALGMIRGGSTGDE